MTLLVSHPRGRIRYTDPLVRCPLPWRDTSFCTLWHGEYFKAFHLVARSELAILPLCKLKTVYHPVRMDNVRPLCVHPWDIYSCSAEVSVQRSRLLLSSSQIALAGFGVSGPTDAMRCLWQPDAVYPTLSVPLIWRQQLIYDSPANKSWWAQNVWLFIFFMSIPFVYTVRGVSLIWSERRIRW